MTKENNLNPLSRRKFLGVSLVLPFLPIAKSSAADLAEAPKEDREFVTMLTAEGKTIKVRKDALKSAKIVQQKMSNQALLSWLKPKGFNSKS